MGLTSRVFLPEHNHCPLTRIKCGAEKNRIGLQDKPSRQLVLNGFSRGAPKLWIHRWPQRYQNRDRGCTEVMCSTRSAHSTKIDVEGRPCAGKQVPMDFREGSILALGPKTRSCYWRTARLQSDFAVNCSRLGPSWWPTQGSGASTLQAGP